MWRFQS